MRLHSFLTVLKIFAFVFSIAVFSPACSKNEEQVEEEVEDEGEEEAKGSEAAEELSEAEDEEAAEEAPAPDVAAPTEPTDASAIADAEPQATEMDKAVPNATESIAVDPAPEAASAAPAATETFNGERHVYYVKSGANLRAQAAADAPVVGKAAKGDHFVAVVSGSWAQLENGPYVALSAITKRGVGRSPGRNPWRSSK
jgi:hypothetical protein